MRGASFKGVPNSARQLLRVDHGVRMDKQEVHQIATARRAPSSICARVRVQLLGDLPFDRNQEHVDRRQAKH